MSGQTLRLGWDDGSGADCVCLLIIPENAVEEPGYIKGLHESGATSKHEFHALAQTAYYQYQDDELDFLPVSRPIEITASSGGERLESGLVLFRDRKGAIRAIVHETLNLKKLLESANRFCTRWVRLDI